MEIQFSTDLLPNETSQLCDILDCDEMSLASRLSSFGSASIEEYLRMCLGQKVFTRGSDFQQYRLFFC